METTNNSVRKVVTAGAVTVEKIYTTEFQKEGTKTAQLRQTVSTKSFYPSKQVASNMQDNPFSLTEFGFEEQEFQNDEKRVAWIDIPQIIDSVDDVVAKLPQTSCLYKVLSNRPILTSNQVYAVEQGLRTMDDFANSQIVRYGDNSPEAGQIVKDENGKPQYRSVFYSKTVKEDVDHRNGDANDFYASAEIKAELLGAATVAGQSL